MKSSFYRPQGFFSSVIAPYAHYFSLNTVTTRDAYIESLRGLAIILVVFGHIIGVDKTGGMKVADDSIFRYLYFSLEYMRMPLFTVISGWVYASKPIQLNQQGQFIKGKLRRLMVPMFVISTMLFLFRIVIPGTSTKPDIDNLPNLLLFPYDLYWYLYSLFVIFIVIAVLDTTSFFRRIEGWATMLAASFIMLYVVKTFMINVPNVLSFKGAAYLFPFFILGIGFKRYREVLFQHKWALVISLVFFAGIVIQQLVWFGYFPLQSKQSVLGITVGVTAVYLLFTMRFRSNLLMWIGSYAYSIFLFHVFFTGGTRIVLLRLGLDNKWVILCSALIISMIIPIMLDALLRRSRIASFLLLGLRSNEK